MEKVDNKVNHALDVIVLCSHGHLGSIIVLNRLLEMKCYHVTSVLRARKVEFTRKGLKRIKKQTEKTGIMFMIMLVFQQAVQELFFLIPGRGRNMLTMKELSEKYGFKIHDIQSVNDKITKEIIIGDSPSLLISAYFPQILKKTILDLPKIGVLNIHPGLIPTYKGVMAYFWALKNNAQKAGVCIHWMDEGIDTGPIIAMRSFRISKKMSQDKVMIKTALIGSSLLKKIGYAIVQGKSLPKFHVSTEKVGYYSLPDQKQFHEYRHVRAFFSFRTLLKTILGK